MDIHSVLTTAVREVLTGVDKAREELGAQASIDYPTRIEVEFGVTASYEVANYDDVRVAQVRVSIPIFKGKKSESPATEALAEASIVAAGAAAKGAGRKK